MLLPPQFKEEPLKTLGPPIRKEQENKPKEVKVRDGIYRVNGKLETRLPEPSVVEQIVDAIRRGDVRNVSEVDIPLPEFKVGDRVEILQFAHDDVWFDQKLIGRVFTIKEMRPCDDLYIGPRLFFHETGQVCHTCHVKHETR